MATQFILWNQKINWTSKKSWIFQNTFPEALSIIKFMKTIVCNSCKIVYYLEEHHNTKKHAPAEEEYFFSTSYIFQTPIFDVETINNDKGYEN